MKRSLIPPTVEDIYLPPFSQKTVSIAPSFLASMPSFLLTRLISAAIFDICGKNGGGEEEEGMIRGAYTRFLIPFLNFLSCQPKRNSNCIN